MKAQDIFQGIEQWENVHTCYLLLPVPRIAQALVEDFPKEVCDKCVDSYEHLDLLFREAHEEKINRFIYDKFGMIAFCCENKCKQILHLDTVSYILIGISEN